MDSQIFWFGDLNYRINMLDTEVRKLAAQKQWDELRNFDQVTLRSTKFIWKYDLLSQPNYFFSCLWKTKKIAIGKG